MISKFGAGLGLGLGSGGGSLLLTETKAYIAAMTIKPTANQAKAINARIKGLLPVWSKLVRMYFFDIHNEQAARINVVNPTLIATNTNLSHTVYVGYPGASGGFIDTGLNASTDATITLDSIHLGAWVTDVPNIATTYLLGAFDGTNMLGIRRTGTGTVKPSVALNCLLGVMREPASGTIDGHIVATRITGGNSIKVWQNKTDLGAIADQSKTAEVNGNIYICNVNGANWPNTGQTKIAHIGINILQADVDIIYDAINNNPITAG